MGARTPPRNPAVMAIPTAEPAKRGPTPSISSGTAKASGATPAKNPQTTATASSGAPSTYAAAVMHAPAMNMPGK